MLKQIELKEANNKIKKKSKMSKNEHKMSTKEHKENTTENKLFLKTLTLNNIYVKMVTPHWVLLLIPALHLS